MSKGLRCVTLGLMLAVGASAACTSAADNPSDSAAEQELGRVTLALATDATGYRLRSAVFEVKDAAGVVVLTLDSDEAEGAVELSRDLPQGRYSIALATGWALEREEEDGIFNETQAALVTPNPREFEVRHQEVTRLVYAFATDSGVVTLGEGTLSVGIDIVDTGGLTACNVLQSESCPTGFSCLLAGETGDTFCAQPGALPVGAECSSEQCIAGAQCLRLEGEAVGVCRRFCDPSAGAPFCSCQSLSFDADIGVCTQPPECEPDCSAAPSFSFEDSVADDLNAAALREFFEGLAPLSESDYILFELTTGGLGGGAWCASNANFYVNSYLEHAPSAGVASSGNWDKHWRASGGEWFGPDNSSYNNYFGLNCDSNPFDWCSEWGIGNQFLGVMPGSTGWETRSALGVGDTTLKIAIGPSRAVACGF